jgi:amino acid adenylation domain-containing protein
MQTYNGDTKYISIDKNTVKKLRQLAEKNNTTLFTLLFAVFNVFLHKISDQKDFVVGTLIANRNLKEAQNLIGCFLNNLSIRVKFKKDYNFIEFLFYTKNKVLKAIENGDYQFEQLIEKLNPNREISQSPIFNVMFQLHDKRDKIIKFNNLEFKNILSGNNTTKFDLKIRVVETQDDRIILSCEYNTDIFKKETIQKFLDIIETISRDVAKTPNKAISEIELVNKEEKNKLLYGLNNKKECYPKNKPLNKLFEEQVKKTPNLIAVEFEEHQLSYANLNKEANRLAYYLREEKRIKINSVLAIATKRNLDLAVAIIAVHKAGCGCLLIDTSHPKERIKEILNNAKVKYVLVSEETKTINKKYGINRNVISINTKKIKESENINNIVNLSKAVDIAYLVYTSGSTGKPKGVMLSHKNILNTVLSRSKKLDIRSEDVSCLSVANSFVPITFKFYTPLLKGSKLIIYKDEIIRDYYELFSRADKDKVTILDVGVQGLKVYLKILDKNNKLALNNLRVLLPIGEKVEKILLDVFFENYKKCDILIPYGMTEFSGVITFNKIKSENTKKDYDRNIITANNQVYVLNSNLKLLPTGFCGEIYCSGDSLSKGYFNDAQRSKKVFLNHPFIKEERIFKTGDIGKINTQGELEVIGRSDHQIKIRGHRIEPGEIEANLKKHNHVKDAVVIAKENKKDNDKYLVAYYITEKKNKKETTKQISKEKEELKSKLKRILPDYMIPSYFIRLDKFPLNQNGKLDRSNLPEPKEKDLDKDKYLAPKTEIEKKVAKIWQEVLNVKKISRNDNFFNLGGHSLKAIQVVAKINEMFKIEVSLKSVFINPILSEFSQAVDDEIVKKHLLKK